MFIDPSNMDENEKRYWEFARGDILAKIYGGGGDDGMIA